MQKFSIIVAIDSKNGIGKNGLLPWHIPSDLKYFKKITTEVSKEGSINAVIMGKNTWISIPEKFRPLPGRLNIVLSSDSNLVLPEGVLACSSLEGVISQRHCEEGGTNDEAIHTSGKSQSSTWIASSSSTSSDSSQGRDEFKIQNYFIIGGGMLYKTSIESEYLDKLYITEIDGDFGCDTFFPKIDSSKFEKIEEGNWQEENGIRFRFCIYKSIKELI